MGPGGSKLLWSPEVVLRTPVTYFRFSVFSNGGEERPLITAANAFGCIECCLLGLWERAGVEDL